MDEQTNILMKASVCLLPIAVVLCLLVGWYAVAGCFALMWLCAVLDLRTSFDSTWPLAFLLFVLLVCLLHGQSP